MVVARAAAGYNGRPVMCDATNGLASPVSTSLTLHVLREYASPNICHSPLVLTVVTPSSPILTPSLRLNASVFISLIMNCMSSSHRMFTLLTFHLSTVSHSMGLTPHSILSHFMFTKGQRIPVSRSHTTVASPQLTVTHYEIIT